MTDAVIITSLLELRLWKNIACSYMRICMTKCHGQLILLLSTEHINFSQQVTIRYLHVFVPTAVCYMQCTCTMSCTCTFIEFISFWYCVDFLAKNSVFFFWWFTASASEFICCANSVSALGKRERGGKEEEWRQR